MLDYNKDRLDYGEMLIPPEGYTLSRAVAATYSLDLNTLLSIPIALFYAQTLEGIEGGERIQLLDAIQKCPDVLKIYHQQGRIHVPRTQNRLYGLIEDCVCGVLPDSAHASFHPKIWVLRYVKDKAPVRYRVIVLSRNLTYDRSWDIAANLDGEVSTTYQTLNKPLTDFVLFLAGIDQFEESAAFLDELSRVEFVQPAKFNTFRFHPIGIAGYSNPIARHKGSGVICISPFVQDKTLGLLERNIDGERWLFGRREELLKLSAPALDGFSPYQLSEFVVDGEQLANAEDGEGEPLQQNLHAKLFVFRRQTRGSRWFIGSANATTAAMERNVEFMLELRGQSDAVQFDRLLDDLLGPDRDTNVFEPFEAKHEATETDQSLEQKLRLLEYDLLKSLDIESARVDRQPTSENYDLHIVIRPGNIRWNDFAVRLAPFNTKDIEAQPLSNDGPFTFCFENINESNLSRFLRFEIHHEGERLRQFLMKIDIDGMPTSRVSRIVRSIINDRDRFFEYLSFLLADDFDKNDDSGSTTKGHTNGDDAQMWEAQAPIFEQLLISASRRPGRLKEIDDVIRQLTDDADDEKEVVPPEFVSFWNAFRQMVPQSQEPPPR
ncbi:phospholipase D family protein [Roseiconus lacunae]|uniref:phospholipase D family protein n=1 Tax=Roseiconus lacunae TaxID=2605694 RepID=UPI001E4FC40D|nr:phospholipase D family protein [Roseiconus lacunae]MCD0459562.1 phospholipase D family protein [Roseiconus lacunae]